MKFGRVLLPAVGLMFFVPAEAPAAEVKVIANPSVKADVISTGEIKNVFLEQNSWLSDGTHVMPVLQRDGAVHKAFLEQYLGKSNEDLQTYYRALVFSGRGLMPRELTSDAQVVAYVAKTRWAIGYVSSESSAEGVKTLAIVSAGNDAERKLMTRVEPEYPETLRRLNIGGIVRLQVVIAPKGQVEKVKLLGGNPILAESAMLAVKQWIYNPGHSRTSIEVSIPFDSRP